MSLGFNLSTYLVLTLQKFWASMLNFGHVVDELNSLLPRLSIISVVVGIPGVFVVESQGVHHFVPYCSLVVSTLADVN